MIEGKMFVLEEAPEHIEGHSLYRQRQQQNALP